MLDDTLGTVLGPRFIFFKLREELCLPSSWQMLLASEPPLTVTGLYILMCMNQIQTSFSSPTAINAYYNENKL